MSEDLWEKLGEETEEEEITPLWSIKIEDDKEVLKWTRKTLPVLQDAREERERTCLQNLAYYKGDHYQENAYIPRDQIKQTAPRWRQVVVNHIFELTEQWVSRMTRYKPAVAVLPANDEHNDRQNARIGEMVIKHLFYIANIDSLLERLHRQARIFGESFIYIYFDPDSGDLHPKWKKAKEENKRVPVKGVKNDDGQPVYIDKPVRVGEVAFKILSPWKLMFDPQCNFEECEYVIIEDERPRIEIEALYPEKKKDLFKPDELGEKPKSGDKPDKVCVYELYHKGTSTLDSGRYIKFTEGCILENTEHPYSHRELPILRLTDIDIPEELHAQSCFENLVPLNNLYNRITSLIYRNIAISAHPKWIMQKGSCSKTDLGNTATIVEYAGGVPPKLEVFSSVPGELFNFRESLVAEMEKISGIHSVSRGEPPPGIRAGIALQFLEEQENQRANSSIVKHNTLIRDIARVALSIAGDYYEEGDGRLIRIVGKSNQYTLKSLAGANLSRPFDIRIQNTSALPETKAGKIQALIDLRQTFGPGLVPDNQVADMIDLGMTEKYTHYATIAIQTAESENEDMLENRNVGEPTTYEEHIAHWQTHMKAVQSRAFKDEAPEGVKQKFFDHIMTHEYLMFEKSMKNQLFAEELTGLDGYPSFFELPPPPPPAEPEPEEGMMPPEGGMPMDPGMGMPPEGDLPPDMMVPPPMDPGMSSAPPEMLPAESAPSLPMEQR